MCCRWDKQEKESKMSEWFLCAVAGFESIAPGMVFGTVDVVCCECGEANSLKCNGDGSNTYICPNCGVRNEL
jgi:predicted RNA-binding Zn-ribbon protein involved in translation (DUF1610 family)